MNFSFLNPLFLIGIAAVALPVIAHFISKKSAVRKKFPSVDFLLASRGNMASRSRLKDLILLSLRAFVLVFLVLVFAKPAVFSYSGIGASEAKTVAILVDNSFSMGFGDNFKEAKEKVEDLIYSLPDGSFGTVAPLVPEGDGEDRITQDRSEMLESLNDIELTYSFTDNERRIEEIRAVLNSTPHLKKEVILVTDFQKNGWSSDRFVRDWFIPVDITEGMSRANTAVSDIDVTISGDLMEVKARVSNHSDTPLKERLVSAHLGGREISGFLDMEPGETVSKEFVFSKENISKNGAIGEIRISGDNLKADDSRHYVLSQSEMPETLIVDGDPREDARLSETYYLVKAVETLSEIASLDVRTLDNDAFLATKLKGYDLIFLANAGEITPEKSLELERFVRAGGRLVVFLGDRIRGNAYNALLKNILPAEIGPVSKGNFFLSTESKFFSTEIGNRLSGLEINSLFKLRPAEDSEVLLTISEGSPFLVEAEAGRGSVFLFASTADTGWNNLPISPIFLPTLKEMLSMSEYSRSKKRNYTLGDTVNVEISDKEDQVALIGPSGERFEVSRKNPVFDKTFLPGIYRLEEAGEISYKFSVNVDPSESNLERISLGSPSSGPAKGGGLVKVFKEIWSYFLWGAVALFVSESLFRALYS